MDFTTLAISYRASNGTPIYRTEAVNKRKRSTSFDNWPHNRDLYLVAHFTESPNLDSRKYLLNPGDGRYVSAHYLAGIYEDMNSGNPSIIKYANETDEACYTQGFGIIGDLASYDHGTDWNDGKISVKVEFNANDACIGYEIEANSKPSGFPKPALLDAVTGHMADIIRYWEARNRTVVLIGHRHLDPHKSDPQLNWTKFAKQVYAQV